MKLQQLVKGADAAAQQALDGLFASLANQEERILWYPSSGNDFRDLLETLSPTRQALHGLAQAPNIFIHTSYTNQDMPLNRMTIHNDGRTVVRALEQYDIELRNNIGVNYEVSSDCVDFTELAFAMPVIKLLKVEVWSNVLGLVGGWVFHFYFENHNFLQEIVLKQQLRITHLVKVREGLGFGYNRKSITLVYALLANMGVRYLLVDYQVNVHQQTHDFIALRFGINHQAFSLKQTGERFAWSDFGVSPFEVVPERRSMQRDDLEAILSTIRRQPYKL